MTMQRASLTNKVRTPSASIVLGNFEGHERAQFARAIKKTTKKNEPRLRTGVRSTLEHGAGGRAEPLASRWLPAGGAF